jgi:hypothetical protein
MGGPDTCLLDGVPELDDEDFLLACGPRDGRDVDDKPLGVLRGLPKLNLESLLPEMLSFTIFVGRAEPEFPDGAGRLGGFIWPEPKPELELDEG